MTPERGEDRVYIPNTIDLGASTKTFSMQNWLVAFICFASWIFLSICFVVAIEETPKTILYVGGAFIAMTLIVRYIVLKERFFRKMLKGLLVNDYRFSVSDIWNIYEISNGYPTIAYYQNGLKAIFVEMKKGVIVGKPKDADFDHHSAITNAYHQLARRGMECMHIDYMDVVGRDDRLSYLFSLIGQCENDDLRKVLTIFIDNVQMEMNKVYADYDVYAFFFRGPETIFWDELQIVLREFREANYVSDKVLNKAELRNLMISLMNLKDFSVNTACDLAFNSIGGKKYLKVISTEKGGEVTILNKTSEEIAREEQIKASEKYVRKGRKGKLFRKDELEVEVDLFNDGSGAKEQHNKKKPDRGVKDKKMKEKRQKQVKTSKNSKDSEIDLFNSSNEDANSFKEFTVDKGNEMPKKKPQPEKMREDEEIDLF
jgi:hypothetical protein